MRAVLAVMSVIMLCVAMAGRAEQPVKQPEKTPAPNAGTAGTSNTWAQPSLQLEDVQKLVQLLPPEQRSTLLNDATAFGNFAKLEAANRSVLAAARASSIDKDPTVHALMQRESDRVMAEAYSERIVRANFPANFPSDEQVRKYYDDNKDKFKAPERIPVWQIFLPIAKDAGDDTVEAVRKTAHGIVKSLRAGKTDFAAAALQYSQHGPSRTNGGYQGLVSNADLLPEIRSAVTALKPDAVSDPVRSQVGFHIIRRGVPVPAQTPEFDDIKAEVRQVLIRDAINQIRQAVLKKVQDTYPVAVDAAKLEDWRKQIAAAQAAVDHKPDAAATGSGPVGSKN